MRERERERKKEKKKKKENKKQDRKQRAERYALRLHDSRERKREVKIRMPFITRSILAFSRWNGSRQ